MITSSAFEEIASRFGAVASWAVWADAGDTPKSNIADLSVLHPAHNPTLLRILHARSVLVGLNFSRPVDASVRPFANFHDPNPRATDFKLRFALRGTPVWGSYMTDIIKHVEEVDSSRLMKRLRLEPELELRSIRVFRDELGLLGPTPPLLIALGKRVEAILRRNFRDGHEVVTIPHYADYSAKEKYRAQVEERLQPYLERLRQQ